MSSNPPPGPKPTVGRIVLYRPTVDEASLYNLTGELLPLIVVQTNPNYQVSGTVFTLTGTINVTADEGNGPGQWNWPQRV